MKNFPENQSKKRKSDQSGKVQKAEELNDDDFRAREENPTDETMEELEEEDRTGFDNNPETSGKPMVPDEPSENTRVSDPKIDAASVPDYMPGEESNTPNENQRTVAAKQFGAAEEPEKPANYGAYIHPSVHNALNPQETTPGETNPDKEAEEDKEDTI
jgi:hypothetical protein